MSDYWLGVLTTPSLVFALTFAFVAYAVACRELSRRGLWLEWRSTHGPQDDFTGKRTVRRRLGVHFCVWETEATRNPYISLGRLGGHFGVCFGRRIAKTGVNK